ncbi:TolB family protein, partial [Actinocorallia lasiicapitis]
RLRFLSNGRLATVLASDPHGPREITEQTCDRAYAAGGTVACLRPAAALSATALVLLDDDLRERASIKLRGFPNRLRVSASGRMVSWTLFLDGHSYATTGFATSTGIHDTRTGTTVKSLEEFAITLDGRPYRNVDVNLWGVTFTADDNRFYATLSTAGRRHLVEGDFAARTLRTVAESVECPSLSPDGTRLAYKSAIDATPSKGWRLSVLDLTTRTITPLSEPRSVDDQPTWLDSTTIAYALQRPDGVNDLWTVPADGSGTPHLLTEDASSPSPPT